ncbi:hypothetical protein BHM03_00026754, partial [Ensete ventricosum]
HFSGNLERSMSSIDSITNGSEKQALSEEQGTKMVWLIDFKGFNLSNISIRTTKETADVLQNHYPERLGFAILYNPPKFFEPFWTVAKHLLEPKTCRKVKFVYSDDDNTKKIMEELFDMDELDCAFGGNNQVGFNINDYEQGCKKMTSGCTYFGAKKMPHHPQFNMKR